MVRDFVGYEGNSTIRKTSCEGGPGPKFNDARLWSSALNEDT